MRPPPYSSASAEAAAQSVAEAIVSGALPAAEAPAAVAFVLGALVARVERAGGGDFAALLGVLAPHIVAGGLAEARRARLEDAHPAGFA